MKNLYKQKRQQGFTIIEVMIVLAVAALILLIVLLAVPALQRNSRNTTIKNDVSTLAGAISTYESDNNGTAPTDVAGVGTGVTLSADGCSKTAPAKPTSPVENASLNGSTTVQCVSGAPTGGSGGWQTTGEIDVVPGVTCKRVSSTRAFALYYNIEVNGGVSIECTDT